MEHPVWWVVTMLKTKSEAESMGAAAIREELAACAQVEGAVKSIYLWNGELQQEEEARLVFKTSHSKAPLLAAWIRQQHPYEVPEILAWPAALSDPDYRNWVVQG